MADATNTSDRRGMNAVDFIMKTSFRRWLLTLLFVWFFVAVVLVEVVSNLFCRFLW